MMLVVSVGCLFLFLLAFTGAAALARGTGLAPSRETHGIGSDAILGAALVVFASGLLMMAGIATAWITGAMLAGLALPGAAKLVLTHRNRPPGQRAWPVGLVLAGAILAAALLVVLALPPSFNAVDDGFAYLALVRDVAVDGVGASQPFSERRLFTYGGHWPMAGIVDQTLGLDGLSLIDPALGLALLGLLIMERVRRGAMPINGRPCRARCPCCRADGCFSCQEHDPHPAAARLRHAHAAADPGALEAEGGRRWRRNPRSCRDGTARRGRHDVPRDGASFHAAAPGNMVPAGRLARPSLTHVSWPRPARRLHRSTDDGGAAGAFCRRSASLQRHRPVPASRARRACLPDSMPKRSRRVLRLRGSWRPCP